MFNPNTGKYGPEITPYLDTFHTVNLRIQSEYRKIRTRNNSVFGHFSRSDSFFHRTILTMQNHMRGIEDIQKNYFIPAINVESSISQHLLPIRFGGMTVATPHLSTET